MTQFRPGLLQSHSMLVNRNITRPITIAHKKRGLDSLPLTCVGGVIRQEGMVKKSKLGALIGGFILSAWLTLLPIYLITGEGLYLSVLILLGIFMAPLIWGFITELVGEDKLSKVGGKIIKVIFGLGGCAIFLSGIGIVSFQIYEYLKQGEWLSFTVIDGLLFIDSSWAKEPDDWLGIWKILNTIPLSLALIILAFIVFSGRGENNNAV